MIAYALQDQALIDQVCVRLADIMDSYYNTRFSYLRILLHAPQTKIQREALIGYAAEGELYQEGSYADPEETAGVGGSGHHDHG